jgi:hypothetical protein
MTITLNNKGSYSIDNTSKKLSHLLKECRLEMVCAFYDYYFQIEIKIFLIFLFNFENVA